MNPFDLLIAFLGIAVAFGGFTGVVALIDRKAARVSAHVVSFRVRFLIIAVNVVIALATLPFVFTAFVLPEPLVWRVSCGAFVVIGTAYVLGMVSARSKLTGKQLEGLSTAQFNLLVPLGLLSVLVAAIAAAGFISAMAAYLVGVFAFIMGIASLFLRLVLMLDDSWRNRD
jgi:predicted permease